MLSNLDAQLANAQSDVGFYPLLNQTQSAPFLVTLHHRYLFLLRKSKDWGISYWPASDNKVLLEKVVDRLSNVYLTFSDGMCEGH